MAVTPLELAKVAAAAADDKKAQDLVLIDLTGVSDVCDYFLICTAANAPQMDAVVEGVRERVAKNCLEKPLSEEGRARSTWVLLDYGAVVVHVFRPESRQYYRLENLWGDAPRVPLSFLAPEDGGDEAASETAGETVAAGEARPAADE